MGSKSLSRLFITKKGAVFQKGKQMSKKSGLQRNPNIKRQGGISRRNSTSTPKQHLKGGIFDINKKEGSPKSNCWGKKRD